MVVSAERITAEQALNMGLIDVVSSIPEKEAIARLGIP
jgi:enoyl-CoA hydratase/carnithine racemase